MKNKCRSIISLLLCAFLLVGCSATELEERSFPMLVAAEDEDGKVIYKDAFPKEDALGGLGAKEKDYNHLKVFVLEEELLEKQKLYEAMLEELAEKEIFPRNTYVCVMEDIDALFEMEKQIEQDLGIYLEEYLKKYEGKSDKLVTLGDLLDEQLNNTIDLYLPHLEVEDNVIHWEGYVNISGKTWKESD